VSLGIDRGPDAAVTGRAPGGTAGAAAVVNLTDELSLARGDGAS
jgi:hypothetical protein